MKLHTFLLLLRRIMKEPLAIAMALFLILCVGRRTQMNEVALRANDVLRNDVGFAQ